MPDTEIRTTALKKRQIKYTHSEDLLNRYQNYIRKTWCVLNNITGRSHDKTTISDTFIVNGDQVNDKTMIANEFCSYFTNIGRQYAEAIPRSMKSPESYVGNSPNLKTMYLTPTGPREIEQIIKSFKTNKSTLETVV